MELRPFNHRQLNRDLGVLCAQVNAATPRLPHGRHLLLTVSTRECHHWDRFAARSAPALPCPLCACLVVLPGRRGLHTACRCSCAGTAPRGDARWSIHLDSGRRSWFYRDLLAVHTIPAVWRGTIATPRDCNEFLIRSKLMVALLCRTRRASTRT